MEPTDEQLEQANCLFSTDRVSDPQMRAFKREARWRQHRWAVDVLGIERFGWHRGRNDRKVPNGTKLTGADAKAGANFLSQPIRDAVKARLAAPQDHETLNSTRLRGDLLSSMPMAFNLFGEAAGPDGVDARRQLARRLAPGVEGDVEIRFEWSPARRDALYTRDRTAFDVTLVIGDAAPFTVVGIETKYHEHSVKEPRPSEKARANHEQQTQFLVDLAERSGAFVEGWRDAVLDTDLRQIWRDHLLALSMRAHPEEWGAGTRYVLVHPRRNVSFAEAADRYRKVLRPDEDSFGVVSIEELVDAAFAGHEGVGRRFVERYLG